MRKKPFIYKLFFITASVVFVVLGIIFLWAATISLPDLSTFQARKIANSSKIVDRTGQVVLYDIHQSVRRSEVPLEKISNYAKNATIAIEDAGFYKHKGISFQSIIRATITNLTSGSFSQGGSTITQQIIKNTLLTPDKKLSRKIKEWVLAIKLERSFPKDKILEIYLNDNPYGGMIYGIEEASRAFFNKSSSELTLAESAYLAAIPQAPTYYSPFGKHKNELDNRKNLVLKKMLELGFVSKEEYLKAKEETVSFDSGASNGIKAPHFVFYIQELLEEKYGKEAMASGGYTIVTTLDYEIQQKAEEIVKKHALENFKKFKASNASLVAINPKTGEILAMVGSRDYFDKEIDGAYNIATAERQPGSSFKPFVYAAAFEKGYTPETVLFDVPTEFSAKCSPVVVEENKKNDDCYNPNNFDNKWRGPMQLKNALAQSINVPSVKLLYLVGIQDAIDLAKKMGITTLKDASNYGLSLVLGGGEVSLLDMVSSYGVFANNGVKNEPVGILKVLDKKGEIIEEFTQKDGEKTLQKNTALQISDILSDNQARTPTFGASSSLFINEKTAAKTGTTNDNRDAWLVGYNTDIVVGVWSGNNDNKEMLKGGAAISGPLWNEFMRFVIERYPGELFEKPSKIDGYENLKPVLRGEWLTLEPNVDNKEVSIQTILYFINKEDPLGPSPINPQNDPQFNLWNIPVQKWWLENKYRY